MAQRFRPVQGLPHQGGADAETADVCRDRERSEQQAQMAGSGGDRPEPHRADKPAGLLRDECEAIGGPATFAQTLRALGGAAWTECSIEQVFARCDVGAPLLPDLDVRELFEGLRAADPAAEGRHHATLAR
jgi:hypothetical protein